jgi:hypothetical protein
MFQGSFISSALYDSRQRGMILPPFLMRVTECFDRSDKLEVSLIIQVDELHIPRVFPWFGQPLKTQILSPDDNNVIS